MSFSKLKSYFFSERFVDGKLLRVFFICLISKFMWFNLLWCLMSTFTPFSKIETYFYALLITLVLLIPLVCFRAVKVTFGLFVLMDILLVTNLMYFRIYFTAIPLNSYLLIGNLTDFTSSVWDSMRVSDLFFPLSTFYSGFLFRKNECIKSESKCSEKNKPLFLFSRYMCLILLITLVPGVRIWNQNVIAPVLGFDSLVSKTSFVQEEPVGSRGQVGDRAFLRQCTGKITANEVWRNNGNTWLQCITYSGHNPFILPDSLKQIFFSSDIPETLNNYMTMANYTDRAIGDFVSFLRSDRRFDKTLIVITGDHEGLAGERKQLCADPIGQEIVSDKPFIPLIILNAPFAMHYGKVMGQIDIYPTLLDLLNLEQYAWRGLGQSIFDPEKSYFAIDPLLNVVGDTTGVPEEEIHMAQIAWEISDLIIHYDYLRFLMEEEASRK